MYKKISGHNKIWGHCSRTPRRGYELVWQIVKLVVGVLPCPLLRWYFSQWFAGSEVPSIYSGQAQPTRKTQVG